jgi:hypothetical protein
VHEKKIIKQTRIRWMGHAAHLREMKEREQNDGREM